MKELAREPEEHRAAHGHRHSKTVTWFDPDTTARAGAERNGADFLDALRDGLVPPPPIASLLGFRIAEVEHGRVVVRCTPDETTYNPIGTVHGGLVCTLADTAIACAVHSTLPKDTGYTSVDLAVSYLRPVTRDSGVLTTVGTVTKPGRRVAFARAEITDAAGRTVATATGCCLVFQRGER